MLKFSLYTVLPDDHFVSASFDDEPEPRKWLLHDFLEDMYGQEDLYLREIAKAEAGETPLNLYNNWVSAELSPDGKIILEELRYNAADEANRGPPARTEITLAEAKQLILDWLAAKKAWQAQRAAAKAAAATASTPGSAAAGTATAASDKT